MVHPSEASAREKLRRAESHLSELSLAIATYRDSYPYRVLVDPPGDRGAETKDGHRVLLWFETPPAKVGAITGDIVTNLRSALDHVVWGLADPQKRGTHTKFPIHVADTAKSRKDFSRALDALDEPAVEAIERMQPYHGPGEPRDRPLAVLAELVNQDKHRNLITARMAVPMRKWFAAFTDSIETVEPSYPFRQRFGAFLDDPATKGAVVLVDPDLNVWEIQLEVDAPAVQVVTNTTPQREILDTLQNVRVAVIEALDKICGYLGDYETTRPDKPRLLNSGKPAQAPPPEG